MEHLMGLQKHLCSLAELYVLSRVQFITPEGVTLLSLGLVQPKEENPWILLRSPQWLSHSVFQSPPQGCLGKRGPSKQESSVISRAATFRGTDLFASSPLDAHLSVRARRLLMEVPVVPGRLSGDVGNHALVLKFQDYSPAFPRFTITFLCSLETMGTRRI